MDLDSHDAPVLAVAASARSANRLLVSRPAGLHAARLGEGEEQKKIEDWLSCEWTSIWERRRRRRKRGRKRRPRFSKNDIVGVAVRPWPVGERREGLLEKVCGKKDVVFCHY